MNAWGPSEGAEKKQILSRRGKTKRRTQELTVPTVWMSRWSCSWWRKTLKRARSQVQKSCRNSKQRLRLTATTCHRLRDAWQAHLTWQTTQHLTPHWFQSPLTPITDRRGQTVLTVMVPQWHFRPLNLKHLRNFSAEVSCRAHSYYPPLR